ncbi:hypothetical protein ACLOJK_023365 [Asimina triloba]
MSDHRSYTSPSGVSTASPRGEPEGHQNGEASGPTPGTHLSTGGSPTPVFHCLGHTTRLEERPKKRKRLGPTTVNKEAQERLVRQEEEDLQAGLALSHEKARRSGLFIASPEASVDPTSFRVSAFTCSQGVEADTAEAQGSLSERDADPCGVGVPMRHGILRSTFGEASFYPSGERLFCQPFDMKVKSLKILGDFLPVQSRGIRECHALGLTPSLNKEGRGVDERMLLKYLPDVWKELSELEERVCLIDGCVSWAKHRYHEECQKIITTGKRPKEVGLEAEREHCQVKHMVEGERHFFFQLLEMGQHANRVEVVREGAERALLELLSVWDATTVKLDKARDDTEGVSLTKQDLDAKASLLRLSNQADHAQEEASKLLFELDVVWTKRDEAVNRVMASREESKVKALRAHDADPSTNEESSRVGLEATRGEASTLQERVVVLSSRESELLAES